jgi:hypothetical protein
VTANRIRWRRVSVRRGVRGWNPAYLSACGRFQVVKEMGGPLGSTWWAYDLLTGDSRRELYSNLKPCQRWCEERK